MDGKIVNAQITGVSLGYEDHGILTFRLGLEFANGGCCLYGGYALDSYDKEKRKRVAGAKSMECLTEIMRVVGVRNWEDLNGKYIRVVDNGRSSCVDTIGNLMKDEWFNISKFFEEGKTNADA